MLQFHSFRLLLFFCIFHSYILLILPLSLLTSFNQGCCISNLNVPNLG
jgi:hypothetical protein